MRAVIVGAGAVGGTLAARLAAAGHEVGVVARGEHLQAMQRQGLVLQAPHERLQVRLRAEAQPEAFGPQDLVAIALKAHQIGPMLPRLRRLLQPDTVVLPMINGIPWWYGWGDGDSALTAAPLRCLDPQGRMLDDLDPRHIVGCVVHASAEVVAPGVVQGNGQYRYVIGEPTHRDSARVQALAEALRAAGCAPEPTSRIRDAIWMKLVGNATFNPVAALTRLRMDEICADDALIALIRAGMQEVMDLARALGCDPQVSIEQRLAIARGIGPVTISTLQDVLRGRKLEIDGLLCAPLELAQRAAVAMPVLSHLAALLAGLDRAIASR